MVGTALGCCVGLLVGVGVGADVVLVGEITSRALCPKMLHAHPLSGANSLQPHFPAHATATDAELHVAAGRRQNSLSKVPPSHPKHDPNVIRHANRVEVAVQSTVAALQTVGISTVHEHNFAPL